MNGQGSLRIIQLFAHDLVEATLQCQQYPRSRSADQQLDQLKVIVDDNISLGT
jgi:hypothetical protein